MALLVYVENQTVFLQRGIRAQMGFIGGWIELRRERKVDTDQMKNSVQTGATYKRTLDGLQSGGIYYQTMMAPERPLNPKGSFKAFNRTKYNQSDQ